MSDREWRRRAICTDLPTEVFFPLSESVMTDEAQEACSACPVTAACLEYALETRNDFGIYGGMTSDERKFLRRHRQRAVLRDRDRGRSALEEAS